MKKALAYVITAVLLGFAVMMLPLTILTGSPSPINTQSMSTPAEEGATKYADSSIMRLYGLANQPTNLLPSSLVFFSGLIVALTAYVVLKKRIP